MSDNNQLSAPARAFIEIIAFLFWMWVAVVFMVIFVSFLPYSLPMLVIPAYVFYGRSANAQSTEHLTTDSIQRTPPKFNKTFFTLVAGLVLSAMIGSVLLFLVFIAGFTVYAFYRESKPDNQPQPIDDRPLDVILDEFVKGQD